MKLSEKCGIFGYGWRICVIAKKLRGRVEFEWDTNKIQKIDRC